MTRVFLADDHRLFTDLVGAFLVVHGFEIVGVATTEAQAARDLRATRPDVCLLDPPAIGVAPVGTLARLAAAAPATRLVVLTGTPDRPGPDAALAAGAVAHLAKGVSGDELLASLDRVVRGERVVLVGPDDDHESADSTLEARRRVAGLRARERECLGLIVEGVSTARMASTMGVTPATVRSHVRSVLATLGVHTRLAAASFVLRHGLRDEMSSRAG